MNPYPLITTKRLRGIHIVLAIVHSFFNKKPVYKKLYLRFQQAKKHVLYILNAKKLMVIKLWC